MLTVDWWTKTERGFLGGPLNFDDAEKKPPGCDVAIKVSSENGSEL